MLLTKEGQRPHIINVLIMRREQRTYPPLANPSLSNIFKVFDILRHKRAELQATDNEGNLLLVSQEDHMHSVLDEQYTTHGVLVVVRQKLPEDRVGGEKYLSIRMSRDEKGDIELATCVVVPTKTFEEQLEYGPFMRIGDLRFDSLSKKKGFIEGSVDGNDEDFGFPTGEWFIDNEPFNNALERAYAIMVHTLFNIGEVPPLGTRSNGGATNLLESGKR